MLKKIKTLIFAILIILLFSGSDYNNIKFTLEMVDKVAHYNIRLDYDHDFLIQRDPIEQNCFYIINENSLSYSIHSIIYWFDGNQMELYKCTPKNDDEIAEHEKYRCSINEVKEKNTNIMVRNVFYSPNMIPAEQVWKIAKYYIKDGGYFRIERPYENEFIIKVWGDNLKNKYPWAGDFNNYIGSYYYVPEENIIYTVDDYFRVGEYVPIENRDKIFVKVDVNEIDNSLIYYHNRYLYEWVKKKLGKSFINVYNDHAEDNCYYISTKPFGENEVYYWFDGDTNSFFLCNQHDLRNKKRDVFIEQVDKEEMEEFIRSIK